MCSIKKQIHGKSQTNQGKQQQDICCFHLEKSKWDFPMTETEINFIGINTCGGFTHARTEHFPRW